MFGGGSNAKKYPTEIGAGIKHTDITNDPNYTDRSWQESRGYSFKVVRVDINGNLTDTNAVGNKGAWQEFRLQINPQELSQDEVFAIEVTPTLRGILVEHHGTILKDIQISGTTGISPLRGAGGANRNSGNPLLASGHSGFEEFHELRSYFRMYSEAKRLDDRSNGELRMVFFNYKDREALYVEPQKFSMKRSSTRPFLYDYNIVLKGIGVYGAPIADPTGGKDIFGTLDNVLDTVTSTLSTATQVIQGSIGIITQIERSVTSAVLTPLQQLNTALTAIKGGENQLLGPYGITRLFTDALRSQLTTLGNNLSDAFGINMSGYNAAVGRTSTLSAPVGTTPTYTQYAILNAFQQSNQAIALLNSQSSLFDENVYQANASAVAILNSNPNSNVQIAAPNSTRPANILGDDTIQTIAARELGNPDNYRDIVILNSLKPPYINTTGSPIPGTLMPGQAILIPQQKAGIDTGVTENKIYNITRTMTAQERAFGVDMQLTAGGDIAVSNVGDANLIAGIQNLGQAISIKLALERGGLKRHPGVGTGLVVGEKMTTAILNNIKTNILSSLGSDPRIESIPVLQVQVQGGTTSINMMVKPATIAQPIPLPINVNTG